MGSGVRDVDGEGEATAPREALALGVVASAETVAELADTLCEGDGLDVAAATVGDDDVVGVPDGVAPWLKLGVAVAVGVGVPVDVGELVADCVGVGVPELVGVGDGVLDADDPVDNDEVGVKLGVGVIDGVVLGVGVTEATLLDVGDGVLVADGVDVGELDGVREPVPELLALEPVDKDGEGVCEGVPVTEMVVVGVPVVVKEGEGVAVCDGVGVLETENVGEGEGLVDAGMDGDKLIVGVTDALAPVLRDGVGDAVTDGVMDAVADRVGEGEGDGATHAFSVAFHANPFAEHSQPVRAAVGFEPAAQRVHVLLGDENAAAAQPHTESATGEQARVV